MRVYCSALRTALIMMVQECDPVINVSLFYHLLHLRWSWFSRANCPNDHLCNSEFHSSRIVLSSFKYVLRADKVIILITLIFSLLSYDWLFFPTRVIANFWPSKRRRNQLHTKMHRIIVYTTLLWGVVLTLIVSNKDYSSKSNDEGLSWSKSHVGKIVRLRYTKEK